MPSEGVAVLGAGPAGLYVALRLARAGQRVTVLEKEAVVGGLAAALRRGGNVFGHGFHSFHDADPGMVEECRTLSGPAWRSFPRDIKIRLRGRYLSYPLQGTGLLLGLPPSLLVPGLIGFLAAMAAAPFRRTPPRDAEAAIIRIYGRALYRSLFQDYTRRFWGRAPSSISPKFVEARLPRLQPVERLKKWFGRLGWTDAHLAARLTEIGRPLMHTTTRGTGAIYEAFAREIGAWGGCLLTGAEATAVESLSGRVSGIRFVRAGREEALACRAVVSTIPLPQLIDRLVPAPPPAVRESAGRLAYRGLVTVGFRVARSRVLPAMMTYHHGRVFHRVSEPKVCGVEVHPAGETVLLAEMTGGPCDPNWREPDRAAEESARDLEAEGLIRRSEIRETCVFRAAEAYPSFALGFERPLAEVLGYVSGISGLVSTGRQGRFAFLRSVEAMRRAWADVQAAGLGAGD